MTTMVVAVCCLAAGFTVGFLVQPLSRDRHVGGEVITRTASSRYRLVVSRALLITASVVLIVGLAVDNWVLVACAIVLFMIHVFTHESHPSLNQVMSEHRDLERAYPDEPESR